MTRWLLPSLLAALIAAILAVAPPRNSTVWIHNRSDRTLESVIVWGAGFLETIPRIGAGERVLLQVLPRGESGLGLTFAADAEIHEVAQQGRFGPVAGYSVQVDVAPDLGVHVKTRRR